MPENVNSKQYKFKNVQLYRKLNQSYCTRNYYNKQEDYPKNMLIKETTKENPITKQ